MAKKAVEQLPRVKIYSPYFVGYIDEMPEEAKERMRSEKPEVYKGIFEPETTPTVEE